MAIQYMDNFQFYGSNKAELLKGTAWVDNYSGTSLGGPVLDPAGTGKYVLRVETGGGDTDDSFRMAVPSPGNKIGIAFRWRMTSMPSTSVRGATVAWKRSDNKNLYGFRVTPTGQITFFRAPQPTLRETLYDFGDRGGVDLGSTGPLIMAANTWKHVEAVIDTTTGEYEIRVEGVQVLSGTDSSPLSHDIGLISFLNKFDPTAAQEPTAYIKDLIVWDDTGTQNNTFIGPCEVYSLTPNADVSSGWAKSSGSSDYALIDELSPVDTDYIQAGDTLPAAAIVQLTDLPADVVSVRGLQTVVRGLKTDGGDARLQVSLVSGASTDDGADTAPNTSARYQWDISEIDPATAAPWTPIAVNAAQLKLNRTL